MSYAFTPLDSRYRFGNHRLQAMIVQRASSMLLKFPASPFAGMTVFESWHY